MSSSPLDSLVEIMSSIQTDARATFALSTLLVYDSVINFDREVVIVFSTSCYPTISDKVKKVKYFWVGFLGHEYI